jgi:hypothetical protein
MRQTAGLFGLLFCGVSCGISCGTAFAADSQLLNLVMPDAKIIGGINATTTISSPLGHFLLSKIGGSLPLPGGLIGGTGFNPLQDVTEILAATAADPANPGGLVLASGTFQVDQIAALLTANGAKANWQASTYGGATLFSTTNPKGKDKVAHAVAFLGNSIAIAGDLASVKAAIDRSTGSNSIDPALAVTVNQLSGSEDEWLASSASIASLLPAKTAPGAPATGPAAQVLPLLKSIQAFNGGIKFGDTVALTGEAVTSSAQNAAALNAVIKLGLLMVGPMTANAAGNQQIAELVQLLQTLQVATNGPDVNLSLAIPESQLESLVSSAPAVIFGVRPVAARIQ